MLQKNTQIFVSSHSSDENLVLSVLEQVRTAGWYNVNITEKQADRATVLELIQQSGMVLIFLSKAYAQDDQLMLEEFAYAATVTRKPFIPVWLDSIVDIQQIFQNDGYDRQLLSALEMLTAKNRGTTVEGIVTALEQFMPNDTPYKPTTPQVCEKPCEAYEGDAPYIFISYAHDDAPRVYPPIKELYESGWDLWYDEGIKITERYLPVIAHHVKRCSVFVLMLTNRCLERPFVMNYELEYARQRGIPIIPVLLEELNPQPWSRENVTQLLLTAIVPDTLLERICTLDLKNQGTRIAVPPAIKHNVVYDVCLPPELPGFRFTVQGDEITITRYIGNKRDVVIPDIVTSLDGSAFRVTVIDNFAFMGGFFKLILPKHLKKDKTAFRNCRLLTSVIIPNTVRSIGGFAFSGCKSLKKISIPDSVKNIDGFAFQYCKSLDNIIIPNNIDKIDDNTFSICKSLSSITIPESVTSINDSAFEYCFSLKNITIPNSVTNIGSSAFISCKSLRSITIPNSVTSIGDSAFSKCASLTSVIITNSDTVIKDRAFANCKSLKTVILPDKNEKIGYAFSNCPQLDAIFSTDKTTLYLGPNNWKSSEPYSIPDGVTKINNGAFSSPSFLKKIVFRIFNHRRPKSIIIPRSITEISNEAFADYRELKSIIIPNSVTSIGISAFKNCRSLRSIIIPERVTKIEDYTFYYCRSLKNITIPESVNSIGNSAFKRCYSLKNIVIPKSITNIGDEAFLGCKYLKNFVIPETVTQVGKNIFGNISNNIFTKIVESRGSSSSSFIESIRKSTQDMEVALENFGSNVEEIEFFNIPMCPETPRAKVCCAICDVDQVSILLTELYWEGFNLFFNEYPYQQEIDESQCVLAFISDRTTESELAMNILRKAVHHDVSRIIQVFLGDCTDLPDEIKSKLHDRQAIIQKNLSAQEFAGKIRDSLRQFGCTLGHPRGFDIKNLGDSVKIEKFHPTDFKHVIIPKTFLNPPLPVSNIGEHAFAGCKSLTSVIIPEGVTSIDSDDDNGFINPGAFMNCESLRSIIIPGSVINIGNNAFKDCSSNLTIYTPHDSNAWRYAEEHNINCAANDTEKAWTFVAGMKSQALEYIKEGDIYKKAIQTEEVTEETEKLYQKAAEVYYQKALGAWEKIYEQDGTTETLSDLAASYAKVRDNLTTLKRYEEAEVYCQKTIDTREKICEQRNNIDDIEKLAWAYDKMGDNLKSLNRLEGALEYYQKSVNTQEKVCEEKKTTGALYDFAWFYIDLRNTLTSLKRYEEAGVYCQKTIDTREKICEQRKNIDDFEKLAWSYSKMGDNLKSLIRLEEALEYYQKAVNTQERVCEERKTTGALYDLAGFYVDLRNTLTSLKRYEEAGGYCQKTIDAREKICEQRNALDDSKKLAWAYNKMGDNLKALNRLEEAGIFYHKAIDTQEKIFKQSGTVEAQKNLSVSYKNMGDHLTRLGQTEEAETYYRKALDIKQ